MSHGLIEAKIVRWVDADTVVLLLDVWPTISVEEHIRLEGYDAPERGKKGSDPAIIRVNALCPVGSKCYFRLTATHKRSFVRYVGQVFPAGSPQSVSYIMTAEGLTKADFA